jgi:F420-non-reducing hydrogenase small subunit
MPMADKPKLAIYWASSCGGCEIAVANLHEKLLDVVNFFDFMFSPCLLDTKKKDIEALPDGSIAATLFNGAIRTAENEEMARLMRRKSGLLIAYGSCAMGGGIPALSNLHTRDALMRTVYLDSPSLDNPRQVIPQTETRVAEGELELPRFYDRVRNLSQVVPVDYSIPGCPPETDQIWNVLQALMSGAALPPRGSVLGAGDSSVCDECARKRTDKTVKQFRRIWEFVPDPEQCLLEQGLLCMGVATRSGCGGKCPSVNMPCIGCYGAPPDVYDQGAKLASTLGSIIDIAPIRGLKDEPEIYQRVDRVLEQIPDLAGVACKFSMAAPARPSTSAGESQDDENRNH